MPSQVVNANPSDSQVYTPFPQIDIIGAMMIVWRVRWKIIRSVLCNIVCNDCAQRNAHIHVNRHNSSLDWVLSHWAHFTVLIFIFVYVLFCVHCMHVYCNMVRWTWWDRSLSLGLLFPSVLWHCWLGHLVTGHFTYETFRLLDTSPTTWTLRLMDICRWQFLYNETLQQAFRPLLSNSGESTVRRERSLTGGKNINFDVNDVQLK